MGGYSKVLLIFTHNFSKWASINYASAGFIGARRSRLRGDPGTAGAAEQCDHHEHAHVPLFIPFLLPLHLLKSSTTAPTRDAAVAEELCPDQS